MELECHKHSATRMRSGRLPRFYLTLSADRGPTLLVWADCKQQNFVTQANCCLSVLRGKLEQLALTEDVP